MRGTEGHGEARRGTEGHGGAATSRGQGGGRGFREAVHWEEWGSERASGSRGAEGEQGRVQDRYCAA